MITCDDAQLLVSGRLDGALSDTETAQLDAHLVGCAECRAVARDLESLHADAAMLPVMTPSRDLWAGIEARIEAPVVSLDSQRRPLARWTSRQVAAAAAVLMAVTAGGTWFAATRTPASAPQVAAAPAPRTQIVAVAAEKGMNAYESEIGALRNIIETRRNELDSATVVVLEKNLKIIDQAINECKTALTANPTSAFLADQLGRAYDTKLELLRSAALLPSRT
jgi:hypothetical protein